MAAEPAAGSQAIALTHVEHSVRTEVDRHQHIARDLRLRILVGVIVWLELLPLRLRIETEKSPEGPSAARIMISIDSIVKAFTLLATQHVPQVAASLLLAEEVLDVAVEEQIRHAHQRLLLVLPVDTGCVQHQSQIDHTRHETGTTHE